MKNEVYVGLIECLNKIRLPMNKLVAPLMFLIFWSCNSANADVINTFMPEFEENSGDYCLEWESESKEIQLTKTILIDHYRYFCGEYPNGDIYVSADDSPWESQAISIYKTNDNVKTAIGLFGHDLETYTNNRFYAVEIPNSDSDTIAIVNTIAGSSNIGTALYVGKIEATGISTLSVLYEPLNVYQANQRSGSEMEIEGFYLDSNGRVLINSLKGYPDNYMRSKAGAKYYVLTMEYREGEFFEIARKDYNINTYKK